MTPAERPIFCCACQGEVMAVLKTGKDIYPHRQDLADLPFWQCPACRNWVGCHHKTEAPTTPLGVIPTPELRRARGLIHGLIDPLWKSGKIARRALYSRMNKELGWKYHTAETRDLEACRAAYRVGLMIKKELYAGEMTP